MKTMDSTRSGGESDFSVEPAVVILQSAEPVKQTQRCPTRTVFDERKQNMAAEHGLRVAVNGANGFIGVHIAAELIQQGHTVVGIVRPGVSESDSGVLHGLGATTVPTDISDQDALAAAMQGCDCLVHLIGSVAPRRGERFDELHQGTAARFFAAAGAAQVRKAVMVSTLGAAADAASDYHRTKWKAEQRLRESGLEYVILRSSLVAGRAVGHRDSKIVRRYLNLIAEKKRVPLVLGGRNRVQPVAVTDLAAAVRKVIEHEDWNGRVLGIAGGERLTTREFVERLMAAVGVQKPTFALPKAIAWPAALAMEQMQPVPLLSRDQIRIAGIDGVCDPNDLVAELGLQPQPLDELLRVYASSSATADAAPSR